MVIIMRETVCVTLPAPFAAPEEIHDHLIDHLIDQLNLTLRRPGMFGGEVAFQVLINHLLFVERQPEAWAELKQGWQERGLWTSTGPTGAFRAVFPFQVDCCEVASVYGVTTLREDDFFHNRQVVSLGDTRHLNSAGYE
ncbi:hypothetical protein [Streptomyces sp. NPDC056987]|uniref:hypothetical protein n=1 Tax=Streptomyces sp. NPDC056987 TaxID=3345988 RepID=UPI0036375522